MPEEIKKAKAYIDNWIEWNEKKFRYDTDTEDLEDLEVIIEAISSLKNIYPLIQEGHRRIEMVSILAIYYLLNLIQSQQKELKKKDKIIDEMAELIARKKGATIEICHNMKCNKLISIECKKCTK